MIHRRAASAAVLATFLAAGCGGGLNPVSGKATFQGAPAAGAVLIFHPKGQEEKLDAARPTAVVREDGTFDLETVRTPGAAAGEYTVTATLPAAPGNRPPVGMGGGDERAVNADRLRGRFASRATSPLKATVKPGGNQLDPFKLD